MDGNDSSLHRIFHLLSSAGYIDAATPDTPPSHKVAGGISWCIAALNPSTIDNENNTDGIEEALRLVGCPHSLRSSHVRDLDTHAIFPVIQWLTQRVSSTQGDRGSDSEVCCLEHTEGEGEHTPQQLKELEQTEISMKTLSGNLDELNQRKMDVVKQLDYLQGRINEGADSGVQKLIYLMKSLKELERQENHFQSNRDSKHSELQTEISELERKVTDGCDSESLSDGLQYSFSDLLEKLDLKKKQLAARLRDIVTLRRQIDYLPCQSEIIQYEHRLSELYAQIQGKHQQTRKYYATHNALLEIKELMLKETSLLNSIISQFQEAFSSTDGRVKLVRSMEGIVKGSQQKLEKVQLGFREEEKILNDLKDKFAAVAGEQKRCYSLMKDFQVECAKNERFRT